MGFLFRTERRDITTQSLFEQGLILGTDEVTTAGLHRALRSPDVMAAIGHHARLLSTVDAAVYRRRAGRADERLDYPSWLTAPSKLLPRDELLFAAIADLLCWGNLFVLPFASDGIVRGMELLPTREVSIHGTYWAPTYHWNGEAFGPDEIVHLRWWPIVGEVYGASVLDLCAPVWEAVIKALTYARDYFVRGGQPTGILANKDQKLDEDSAAVVKRKFLDATMGRPALAVLGQGWEYTAVSATIEQAQLEALARMGKSQVASLFGLPPEIIGGTSGNSATYKNITDLSRQAKSYGSKPIAAKFDALFTRLLPGPQFHEFDLDDLELVDRETRIRTEATGVQAGIIVPNEARDREGWGPIPGGDVANWPPKAPHPRPEEKPE